jgi:hypothetical protein
MLASVFCMIDNILILKSSLLLICIRKNIFNSQGLLCLIRCDGFLSLMLFSPMIVLPILAHMDYDKDPETNNTKSWSSQSKLLLAINILTIFISLFSFFIQSCGIINWYTDPRVLVEYEN